jgi:4-hydroxy-3-polyprenylbenzoate decarboxylase
VAYYRDLREYLGALEDAGKLRVIREEINKDTELHPLVRWQFRGLEEAEWTGWLFERLTDLKGTKYDGKVAAAIIGANRDVYAMGLQCSANEINNRWVEAYRKPIDPCLIKSSEAPVKEVIHKGNSLLEHGGLYEFPIPMATNGWEALPRFTAVSWHTKDPETGTLNVGTYNGLLMGPLRTSCRCVVNQLATHWDKARQAGKPLPAAAVIGAVPALCMVSGAKIPYGVSEHAIAGGLMREPLPVVQCETVDLEVPATAEIVLEGELSTDWLEPDGASGEHTGYTVIGADVFSFHVKCITHRRSPIWHDFISQMPPSESSTIRGVAAEGSTLNFLQRQCGIPQVKSVAYHHCSGAYRMCVIQIQDIAGVRTHPSIIWQAMLGCLARSPDYPKVVIAVDEDIDPNDFESVFWAVSFCYQPHRDTKIIQGRGATLDQSAAPYVGEHYGEEGHEKYPRSLTSPEGASTILMDATRKFPYSPISLPTREYMERAKSLWEKLELPKLKPRSPWYGRSLGVWPEEFQIQASLGERGEFESVQKRIISRGRRI